MQGVVLTAIGFWAWGMGLGLLLWSSGWDMSLTYWLLANYDQNTNNIMRLLGEMGKGSFEATVCLLVGLGLWWGNRPAARVWLWCIPVFLMAGFVGFILKILVGRPRPKEVLWHGFDPHEMHPWVMDAGMWSMPSGHAVSTFAIAVMLMLAFPRYRLLIGAVAMVLGASRFLAVTPHYLGDVVAGAGVGAAVAIVCFYALRQRKLV